MLHEHENERDPVALMNVHLAIRWLLQVWYSHLSSLTISNCFYKSTFFNKPPTPEMNIPRIIDNINFKLVLRVEESLYFWSV
jgi:hypothetical protein